MQPSHHDYSSKAPRLPSGKNRSSDTLGSSQSQVHLKESITPLQTKPYGDSNTAIKCKSDTNIIKRRVHNDCTLTQAVKPLSRSEQREPDRAPAQRCPLTDSQAHARTAHLQETADRLDVHTDWSGYQLNQPEPKQCLPNHLCRVKQPRNCSHAPGWLPKLEEPRRGWSSGCRDSNLNEQERSIAVLALNCPAKPEP